MKKELQLISKEILLDEVKVLGLNSYQDDLKVKNFLINNTFLAGLKKLKQSPPSQFDNNGVSLVVNESPDDLNKYKDGYLDTINKFEELAPALTFGEGIEEVTRWQNKFEAMKTNISSEFWYTEGCRLACFDLLDGAVI